ncbi:hypothetical protein Q5692_20055 [Microcoleus sp. C2C3]|uniref:hypothetical protein n=1 Tax=unclassified Microcoleus TaxID=2642155 RepID=UPI002FD1E59B
MTKTLARQEAGDPVLSKYDRPFTVETNITLPKFTIWFTQRNGVFKLAGANQVYNVTECKAGVTRAIASFHSLQERADVFSSFIHHLFTCAQVSSVRALKPATAVGNMQQRGKLMRLTDLALETARNWPVACAESGNWLRRGALR